MEPASQNTKSSSAVWVFTCLVAVSLVGLLLICLCLFGILGLGVFQWRIKETPLRSTGMVSTPTPMLSSITVDPTWTAFFSDDFSVDTGAWNVGEFESPVGDKKLMIDGVYRWDVTSRRGQIWWQFPETEMLSDFDVTVDIQLSSGPRDAAYGIVFRVNNHQHYLFQIDEQGYFAVSWFDGDKWDTMLEKHTEALRPGEINQLRVKGIGSRFYFFVNGQLVGDILDDRGQRGSVGISLGLFQVDDHAVIEFDNFEISAPASTPTPTRGPSRTLGPTLTPSRTPTPSVTPTLPAPVRATATAQAQWPIVFSDTFQADTHQWPLDSRPNETRRIEEGEYFWTLNALTTASVSGFIQPNAPTVTDFSLAVDVRQVSGSEQAQYGLALISDSGATYTISFNEASHVYRLAQQNGSTQRSLVTGETRAFHAGQPTHINLSLNGSHLRVLVNGQIAIDRDIIRYANETIGLTLILAKAGDTATFAFDNFELRSPVAVTPAP